MSSANGTVAASCGRYPRIGLSRRPHASSSDRRPSIEGLDKALDEALQKGWPAAAMEQDWKAIHPFQR